MNYKLLILPLVLINLAACIDDGDDDGIDSCDTNNCYVTPAYWHQNDN